MHIPNRKKAESTPRLGLRENGQQFALLVLVNAFVGGMVGMERSILPQIAEAEFHIAAKTAILSFIAVFGLVKAVTNYFTGRLAGRFGRKRLLLAGWAAGLPVPLILMFAPDWDWVIAANVLLGINQGLAWSSTVVMKIDLVGERQRGLAMGLNEFAGYLAVAGASFATGWMASAYGLRPYPFCLGLVFALAGLLLSLFWVRDTHGHAQAEAKGSPLPRLRNVFWDTTWRVPNLGGVTQAGLVNNLNDGMAWGLLPILLASHGFALEDIGILTAVYPAVWGVGQLATGPLADRFCKKNLLFWGMLVQGLALLLLPLAVNFWHLFALNALLGAGTALVYPTFLASVAENTHPADRAASLGIFRFWRDLGYAVGALATGLLADAFGLEISIWAVSFVTVLSAAVIALRMFCPPSAAKPACLASPTV